MKNDGGTTIASRSCVNVTLESTVKSKVDDLESRNLVQYAIVTNICSELKRERYFVVLIKSLMVLIHCTLKFVLYNCVVIKEHL